MSTRHLWASPNGRWHLSFTRGDSGATYYTLYDRSTGTTLYPDRGYAGQILTENQPLPKYVMAALNRHIPRTS